MRCGLTALALLALPALAQAQGSSAYRAPPVGGETTFSCTSTDQSISGASGLPTTTRNNKTTLALPNAYMEIDNPPFAINTVAANTVPVMVSWTGGNSQSVGQVIQAGASAIYFPTAGNPPSIPHCSVPTGSASVTIRISW